MQGASGMIISRWGKPCIDALRPAQGDLVVITTLGGRIEALDHVSDYDRAVMHALDLAEERRGYVKVFTMTLTEAVFFCGLTPSQFMADMTDEELRERTIAACLPLLDHPNERDRDEARALLEHWGAMQ
jgi:hypothetical protein